MHGPRTIYEIPSIDGKCFHNNRRKNFTLLTPTHLTERDSPHRTCRSKKDGGTFTRDYTNYREITNNRKGYNITPIDKINEVGEHSTRLSINFTNV